MECSGGRANITEGYWPYFAADGRVRAVQCPPDLCAGGPALAARCASNRRLPVSENPLWYLLPRQHFSLLRSPPQQPVLSCSVCIVACSGACAPGYSVGVGTTACVACDAVHGGYLTLLLLLAWAAVLVLHVLSQSGSGVLKVGSDRCQTPLACPAQCDTLSMPPASGSLARVAFLGRC